MLELRSKYVDATSASKMALKDQDRPLTEKQKAFVRSWATGESILSAAYRAGYADDGQMAYRMSKDPAILKLYNAEKAKYEAAIGMTRQKVMDGLMEAVEMAKIQADPMAMISGWREVGRMCGYYEPVKRQIDINITSNNVLGRMNRLTDAELMQIIEQESMTIDVEARDVLESKDEERRLMLEGTPT